MVIEDPEILARLPHRQGVAGCVGPALQTLLLQVPQLQRALPPGWVRPKPGEPASGDVLIAAHALSTLLAALPGDAVVEEAPSHRPDIQAQLPINPLRQDFRTMASGNLGFGLPAAVGSALAERHRPVMAVVGDGASMYGVQALWTSSREDASLTVLVLDNREYGAVRLHAQSGGLPKVPGMELGGIDFVAVAEGRGCTARKVATQRELEAALRESLARPGTDVLHLPVIQGAEPQY